MHTPVSWRKQFPNSILQKLGQISDVRIPLQLALQSSELEKYIRPITEAFFMGILASTMTGTYSMGPDCTDIFAQVAACVPYKHLLHTLEDQ